MDNNQNQINGEAQVNQEQVVENQPVFQTQANMDMKSKNNNSFVVVLIVLVLAIAGGAFWYFSSGKELFGKKGDNSVNKEDKNEFFVAKGSDSDKSGKKIIDTFTKEVTLNDNKYEVKIELLEKGNQNIYFNGYRVISDVDIQYCVDDCGWPETGEYDYTTDKKYINDTLNELNVIKDVSNDKEYLVITDGFEKSINIVSSDGKTIGNLNDKKPFYGVQIFTDSKPTISNAKECDESEGTCYHKYVLYVGYSEMSVEKDNILVLKNEEVEKFTTTCGDGIKSLTELKYVIKDGSLKEDGTNKVYKTSDGYVFNGVGQCDMEDDEPVDKPTDNGKESILDNTSDIITDKELNGISFALKNENEIKEFIASTNNGTYTDEYMIGGIFKLSDKSMFSYMISKMVLAAAPDDYLPNNFKFSNDLIKKNINSLFASFNESSYFDGSVKDFTFNINAINYKVRVFKDYTEIFVMQGGGTGSNEYYKSEIEKKSDNVYTVTLHYIADIPGTMAGTIYKDDTKQKKIGSINDAIEPGDNTPDYKKEDCTLYELTFDANNRLVSSKKIQ